jgi:hypothetical protein
MTVAATHLIMNTYSYQKLSVVRFEGELLPNWAQLLDLAAKLSRVTQLERRWFSRFTASSGVDDSRTVINRCEALRTAIKLRGSGLFTELQNSGHDSQPAQIIAGWNYCLDTMILVASERKTCAWTVEGSGVAEPAGWGGEGELRRL